MALCSAYDTITATPARVTTVNNFFGPLVTVNLVTASFVQNTPAVSSQQPGLIVNGGDEATPNPFSFDGDVSDVFNVTLGSALQFPFNIQVNGNLPTLTTGPNGEPQGDQLNLIVPGSVNVFSDAATPPNVTITGLPNITGTFGVRLSSIERTFVSPTNGIVNIIGDNDVPGGNQNDYFKVRGTNVGFDPNLPQAGPNQFSLQIGGDWNPATGAVDLSGPIYFVGAPPVDAFGVPIPGAALVPITRINASGGAAAGFDIHGNAIPDTVDPAGINVLDLIPYADNTPRGWGIETYWNQGNPVPDGGVPNPDLLVFGGAAAVSNAITIAPSASTYGQVFDNNAATNTPIAVVNYELNTNIVVNGLTGGNQGNTDTLTLLGTDPNTAGTPGVPAPSGQDNFIANFAAAGLPGSELVKVSDNATGAPLYNLQNFTGFNSINVNMLGGSDFFNLISGRLDGSLTVNVDGGAPSGTGNLFNVDTVQVEGAPGLINTFEVTPGATNDSGRISAQIGGTIAPTLVNFTNTEIVGIGGGGPGATDTLTLDGTQGNDTFQLTGTGPGAGMAQISSGPQILFANLGDTGSTINLNGNGGTDSFTITQAAGWNIANIAIAGNGNDTVHFIGVDGADDVYSYTPMGSNSGILSDTVGGTTTTYTFTGVSTLSLDAQGQVTADSLTFNVPVSDSYFITPGSDSGSGTITINAAGSNLLALSYIHVESVAPVTGGVAVVSAPAGGSIHVDSNGLVTVKDSSGIIQNTYDFSSDTSATFQLDLNVTAGNVAVTIDQTAAGNTRFAGGIVILGGNSSTTGNTVTLNSTIAGDNPIIDFLANTIVDIVTGAISLFGVGQLFVNGTAGVQNTFTLLNYGAYQPDPGNAPQQRHHRHRPHRRDHGCGPGHRPIHAAQRHQRQFGAAPGRPHDQHHWLQQH